MSFLKILAGIFEFPYFTDIFLLNTVVIFVLSLKFLHFPPFPFSQHLEILSEFPQF
jgi:hypothetical protein